MSESSNKVIKEKKLNNKNLIILIVCIILAIVLVLVISKVITGNNKAEKQEEKQEENQEEQKQDIGLDDNTKNELIKIAQLNFDNSSCVNSNSEPLIEASDILNEIHIEDKIMVIYSYAKKNGLLTKITEEDSRCSVDGSFPCYVLSNDTFKSIEKYYGFDYFDLSKFFIANEIKSIGDDLIFSYEESTCDSKIKNDISYSKVDKVIVLTNKISFVNIDNGKVMKTMTKDYYFNPYEENGEIKYYLSSVLNY